MATVNVNTKPKIVKFNEKPKRTGPGNGVPRHINEESVGIQHEKDITFGAYAEEANAHKGPEGSSGPGEEDKAKVPVNFLGEDIRKKVKQVFGNDVIFISMSDQRSRAPDSIYAVAKKNVMADLTERRKTKDRELSDDGAIEELLRKAVQEAHHSILVNKESEWLMETMDIKKALGDAQAEIKLLRGRIEKDKEIPKTKEELWLEIKSLTQFNKRMAETVEHLNSDIKQQTAKYKENERKLKEEISYLEIQAKSTQTEEFKKLKEDNKKLIEENADLKKQTSELSARVEKCRQELDETQKTEEKMKLDLSNELVALGEVKARLVAELEKLKYQKSLMLGQLINRMEMEQEKEKMLRQFVTERNKTIEARTKKEYERQKQRAANFGHAVDSMTEKIMDMVVGVGPRSRTPIIATARSKPSSSNRVQTVGKEESRRRGSKRKNNASAVKEVEFVEESSDCGGIL